ncbi:MAG TPA: serine/threonine-protein kinase [Polyangia bacterium]|nr:serine/threonine-protein kinase [Polyangia bacterium]
MSDAALVAVQTPAPVTTPSAAVEHYGRYHLLERIGKGGMADVFRAMSLGAEGFKRVFVIKRIRAEKSESSEFIEMFCEEARLCALLHHPNIVQVYDFGQIDGSYFLAMEYLRGKDLSTTMRALRLARQAMPPTVAVHIAQQVAAGLHYAHTLTDAAGNGIQIIHRDVTPSNIMLLRTGDVKILDFGIAKATNAGELIQSSSGRVKGKLAYLSPEQVRCSPLDGRADVFALGVVLWEMLTGQRLFSADTEFHTMRNVLNQPVPAPSSKRPGIPPALDAVVARALDKDRDRRYATAQAMAEDLEQITELERHTGQAIPRLLTELFGNETSDVSRELSDIVAHAPPTAAPQRSRKMTPPPPPAAAIADAPDDVVLELDPDPASSPDNTVASPVARSPRRRLVAAVAGATLASCLGWAAWIGTHPRAGSQPASVPQRATLQAVKLPAAPPVVVSAPPLPTPAAPVQAAAPSGSAAISPAAVGADKAAAARVVDGAADLPRARPVRRREAKPLPGDVTIDPFR